MENNLKKLEAGKEGIEKSLGGIFAVFGKEMISSLKKNPQALRLSNKCNSSVYVSFKWTNRAGREEIRQWTLEPSKDRNSYSLAADGEPVAYGKNSVLMHARTVTGQEIWAGSQGSANFSKGKVYFREIQLYGKPRYIELCPK